jgi:HlyD family secretion protein
MKRLWKRMLGIAVAVLVVGAIAMAFMPDPVGVDLAVIGRGHLVVTVDEDGRTRLKDRYEVSAPLAGRMLRIELKAGDRVEAGQTVLARIEPVPPSLLDARAQAESEGRVRAAEAAVQRAEPVLAVAQGELDLARREFERVHEAGTRGGATQSELDRAETAVRQREEQRRAAAFALDIAQYELEVARAALTRTQDGGAAGDAERFEVLSPIAGVVLRVLRESAGVVAPGEALLEVGDPVDLEIEVDVLSVDAVRIREGARAIIEHWGGDEPLAAHVRLIEPSAFTKVSALGVEEQRVNAILDFDAPPPARSGLGDGFRVETRIVVEEGSDLLLAPVAALFRSGREWAVFVEQGGRARTRVVRLGLMNSEAAEVLEGLEDGERVVLYPSDRVAEGVRVRARAAAP